MGGNDKTKVYGGLDFHDIEIFNLALLARAGAL
jgi:hypothetical protein